MRRRASLPSASRRSITTGWEALNLSATSCASLKLVGATRCGLEAAGTGRTTGRSFGAELSPPPPPTVPTGRSPPSGASGTLGFAGRPVRAGFGAGRGAEAGRGRPPAASALGGGGAEAGGGGALALRPAVAAAGAGLGGRFEERA